MAKIAFKAAQSDETGKVFIQLEVDGAQHEITFPPRRFDSPVSFEDYVAQCRFEAEALLAAPGEAGERIIVEIPAAAPDPVLAMADMMAKQLDKPAEPAPAEPPAAEPQQQ